MGIPRICEIPIYLPSCLATCMLPTATREILSWATGWNLPQTNGYFVHENKSWNIAANLIVYWMKFVKLQNLLSFQVALS